jgi:2-methylcitrate dehydratase PrpD
MQKIKVAADDTLLADYPRTWPARVRVAVGPATHEQTATHVAGDPARAFDRAQVRAKFLRFVEPVLEAERAERILTRCHEALAADKFAPLVAEIEQSCRDANH